MATQVEIINMALGHIGIKQKIVATTDDNQEADTAELYWDAARRNALHEIDWGFARRRFELVLAAGTAPNPWAYQYTYPANIIRALRIDDERSSRLPEERIPFRTETNDSNVRLILTGDDKKVDKMERRAIYELAKAGAKDMRAEQEDTEEEASWMQARDGAVRKPAGSPADDYWDDL
jgi:hypothetical protein